MKEPFQTVPKQEEGTITDTQSKELNKSLIRTLVLPPMINNNEQSNPVVTEAEGILEEEVGSVCHICDKRIQGTEILCDKCHNSCHRDCSILKNDTDICIACCATESQLAQQKEVSVSQSCEKKPDQTKHLPEAINQSGNLQTSNKQSSGNGATKADSNASMKQRELRLLENKLRKWEDDLKLREIKLTEQHKENRRL
ncbi:MAG: hypothetical protein N0C90_24920 [Candidatus Thiodiazotropha endolucinida]|nr:hypothetical protein [Candidatus Thiodiazotropha taylori]MCW4264594.1 hypothetical protein [Candidatus Thiodiazotropha endolucinida]